MNTQQGKEMKICKTCNEEKDNFFREARNPDRLQSSCKDCMEKKQKKRARTKRGLCNRIYHTQVQSSKRRGHNPPAYTKEELYKWLMTETEYILYYMSWEASGYRKDYIPSVDRRDDYLGYTMDNIKLTIWKLNNSRGRRDTVNGVNNKRNIAVVQLNKKGDKVNEFYSAHQASRDTGANVAHITACCKGKYGRKTAGGYIWKYKETA